MAITIDSAYVSQFSDNLHTLVREGSSKLMGIFATETARGEKHFFDRLGSFTASALTARLQSTNLQDAPHSRRMASIGRYEASTYLDKIDSLKMLIDPTNDYTKGLADAHGKKFDQVLWAAMLGTAATGVDGTGTQALGAGQQIAHGSAGLTVAKINQALRIMEVGEVDTDTAQLFLGANGWALEDLFNEEKIVNGDYQVQKALVSGKVPPFRGINILKTQRVPDHTAGVTYRAVLFTRDAMKVAMPESLEVKTAEDMTRNFVPVVSTYMSYGAVRMEEALVVDILFQ